MFDMHLILRVKFHVPLDTKCAIMEKFFSVHLLALSCLITLRSVFVIPQRRRCGVIQMQESLDREKKVRADVEKVKRKLETDLKATQEAVEELDRIKKELEDTVRRSAPPFYLYFCMTARGDLV